MRDWRSTETMLGWLGSALLLLAALLPCVAASLLHQPASDTPTPTASSNPSSSASRIKPRSVAPPVKPTVKITAVFEEEDLDDLAPVFERSLEDLFNHSVSFDFTGFHLTASHDLKEMMANLCAHYYGDRSHVRLMVVFSRVRTMHTVNLVSQALGIPVIGYILDQGDGYTLVHNPFYLSLQPSKSHLARGLVSLLAVNFWFRVTMVTQEELRHDGFHWTFRELTQDGKWHIENEVFLSQRMSDSVLHSAISALGRNSSKIFILHASAALARRIFSVSRTALPRRSRFAWITTENAYTLDEHALSLYPLGTKVFFVNQDILPENLLRDVLHLTMETFRGDGQGNSEFIHRLKESSKSSSSKPSIDNSLSSSTSLSNSLSVSSSSSSLSSSLSSSSSSTPLVPLFPSRKEQMNGCWSAASQAKFRQNDLVYSSLRASSIFGLTGQLAFDQDGFMNVTNFKVKNLVDDGRRSVWQDIGCVSGTDVRPFGIIWPGDARSLKSVTDGKKRYRVVTNPVQPFVITEAPHPDYTACPSDTPCLNLTNKFKSQEVVWEAIQAYEEGKDHELYKVQCCRGLTIDLLNKLASDLEFTFTLYIVQDETYGQKDGNNTWSGMMRDLKDNTAHFAVGAFSITSQRETTIDFTDPFFFSGFSIIYSDRTRETSMLAFLEPFSLSVWFAIGLSAQITAVCMALFEWNSPFGLNPWGRKRNKNYSLASGLTMVFSVLFGHTVKTKSPKAWPSKVMQNFWAFAAIFIIASYTANLAAFIAGKHAGINYIDIQDNRLQEIRIGVLPGSAVDEVLKNSGSKLVGVANDNPVPKTDVGIDWVIKGKLDALLGDYPILDYARANLAPSCELKLISKVFGDDRYGIGIPKHSPLKAALSKKITEYHRIGYIDDLTDAHFADAHCIKKRISEEDSKLEVTHHAGLFVMMCLGFGLGVLVLLLEHLIYKFMVPYIRQCPEKSRWRSVHLMFFSQRLQRIINCAELLSPHTSAREMLGIVKKREFTRLFQKSTIRRNRLADIARTKRLNRNFYDIVEKAKWLHQMKESGLMDDTEPETPNIIEIPLKQLTVNVELGTSTLRLDDLQEDHGKNKKAVKSDPEVNGFFSKPNKSDSDSSSAESGDSLLGGSRHNSQRSLSSSLKLSNPALSSNRSLDTRNRRRQFRKHRYPSSDITSSPDPDSSAPPSPNRNRSFSVDQGQCNKAARYNLPPYESRSFNGSRKSLPTAAIVNELVRKPSCNRKAHGTKSSSSSSNHSHLSDSLYNGVLPGRTSEDEDVDDDDDDDDDALREAIARSCEDTGPNTKTAPKLKDNSLWLKTLGDESNNLSGASCSNYSNKALLPKARKEDLARSLLQKTRSYQDNLCFGSESLCAEASSFCLDSVSKEELLCLWKSSELDLNRRLEMALREKARLERRLALLQNHHSPV